MKHHDHTNAKTQLNILQLFIFFICFLIARTSEAQDVTPPTATLFNPADEATEIAVDNWIYEITFDEDVQLNTSNTRPFIVLRRETGHNVAIIDITQGGATISGNVLTIDFNWDGSLDAIPLEENMIYHIEVVPDVIQDLAGNPYEGFQDDQTWNFYTPDTIAPAYSQISPFNGASGVLINESVEITFSEQTNLGSGTFELYEGNTLIQSYSVNSSDVMFSNAASTSRLVANFDLQPEKTYNVRVSAGAVEDFIGNPFEGITDDATWTFTTMDNESNPPIIEYFFPEHNDPEALLEDIISDGIGFEFDEEVLAGSGNIEIRNASTGSLIRSVAMDDPDMNVDGSLVYIYPVTEIPYDTEIDITVCSTCITDILGNPFAGLSAGEWSFTTEVGPLAISSLSPPDETSDVAIDQLFSVTFNQPIQLGINGVTKRAIIRREVGTVFQFVALTVDNISGNTLSFSHDDFGYEESLRVEIEAGVIADLSNASFGGISSTEWNFTTEPAPDVTNPSVESLSPPHQSTDVAVDIGQLQMVFDEDVQKVNPGNIILRDFENNIITQYFPAFEDSDVSVSDNVITMALPADLPYETSFYVQIVGGTIADLSGNAFPGYIDAGGWSFTTVPEPDLTGPSLISRSPEINSMDVGAEEHLVMTFDEDVQLTGAGLLKLFNRSTDEQFSVSFSFDPGASVNGNEITYDIPVALEYGTEYYVELTNAIEDLAGNQFPNITGPDGWYFTTEGELIPPTLTSRSPESGATKVDIASNLEMTFDEDVQLTGGGLFRMYNKDTDEQIGANWSFAAGATVDGNVVTYDIPINLPYETEIYFEISNAIEDEWGNVAAAISGNSDWFVTTQREPDDVPPTIVSLSPVDDEGNAPVDSDFIITFDEPVQKGSGSISINIYSNNSAVQFIDVSSEDVTIDGNTVTIDPPLNLLTDVRFWVQIPSNAFEDLSGNAFAGISVPNKDDWDFTTSLTAPNPPTAVALTPLNGATDVAINAELSVTFSEDIMLGVNGTTKQMVIRRTNGGGGNFAVILLTEAMISGNKLTVPHDDFEPGIVYEVVWNEGVIADLDNNVFEGFAASDWRFTVNDKLDQTITFDPVPNKVFGDSPFELSPNASSGLTVELTVVSGPLSISGNTVSITGAGTAIIAANQAGDDNYNAATTVEQSFEIAKADQTITFDGITNKTFGDDAFTLTATASSQLQVAYSVVSGPASISGNTVSITGAGTVTIAANQVGDDNYNAATTVEQSLEIAKADQVITIDPIDDKLTTDGPFDVSASTTSNLELVYSVTGPATISGTTITLDETEGTVTLTVQQTGSDNYLVSSASTTFNVTEEQVLAIHDETIRIYPNPVVDYLIVDVDQLVDLSIYDLNGQRLKLNRLSEQRIDLSNLKPGIYLLDITTRNGTSQSKIIKAN